MTRRWARVPRAARRGKKNAQLRIDEERILVAEVPPVLGSSASGATITTPSDHTVPADTGRQRQRLSGTSASICPALWRDPRQIDAFVKLLGV